MSLLVGVAYSFVGVRFWTARNQHLAVLAGRRNTTTVDMIPLRLLVWLTVLIIIVMVALALLLVRNRPARGAVIAAVAGLTLSLVGFQETPARFFAASTAASDLAAGGIFRYPHRYGVGAVMYWVSATLMLLAALLFAASKETKRLSSSLNG
jgi:hypothetical protein